MFVWLQSLTGGAPAFIGSLTGSTLGLFALIFAAMLNFRLNRKRDAQVRAEEALSVATALYGEILLLREELAYASQLVAKTDMNKGFDQYATLKFDAYFLERIKLSEPTLYRALASKIGLLDSELILAITKFHADFEAVRTWLPRLVRDKNRKFDHSVLYVLLPAQNAIENIIPTLRRIESMADISTPAEDPDFGDAQMVIEHQQELFSTSRQGNDD